LDLGISLLHGHYATFHLSFAASWNILCVWRFLALLAGERRMRREAGRYLIVHCAGGKCGDVALHQPATRLGNEQRSDGILGHPPHTYFSFILMLMEQGAHALYQEFKNCLLPRSNLDQVFPIE